MQMNNTQTGLTMANFPTTPNAIAKQMTGVFINEEAILPSSTIQNHGAFLTYNNSGILECVWFGGSLEGKSDICIYKSSFIDNKWSIAEQLTDDQNRSEQNPILFYAPDGRCLLLNTAQVGGNQDDCILRMRAIENRPENAFKISDTSADLPVPRGTFIRAKPIVRKDGAWLLPVFHCTPKNGIKWTGKHDTASVAISLDAGNSWNLHAVPNSIGCVHMTLVQSDETTSPNTIIAFFRRRQADYIYRSLSTDGGQNWSTPTPTTLPNNNSSIAAIRLKDGRLAICYNAINKDMSTERRLSLYDELDDKPINAEHPNGDTSIANEPDDGCEAIWGVPRAPLNLALSDDDGDSFPNIIEVHTSTGACLSNNSIDGKNQELSYPALAETPQGDVDVTFTLNRRAIAHVRIANNKLGAFS